MKQLVVLVGLPGSGKTAYQHEQPDWVIVSRSAIRQTMFRSTFEPAVEEIVDRIFHAALVEAVDSSSDVVCIDEPNLTSSERAPFVELALLSGRECVAHVMAVQSPDAAYERMQRNLKRLAFEKPHLRVRAFPRRTYDALASHYEPVEDGEGFSAIARPGEALVVRSSASPTPARARPAREPLPLFTS